MSKNTSKRTLMQKGVIIFSIGFFSVMLFILLSVGGLLRELARLTVVVGIVLIIAGLFKKHKGRNVP